MKNSMLFRSVCLATLTALFFSCTKEGGYRISNRHPVAYAGPDQQIVLPVDSVALKAMATDLDGWITAYEWIKISSPFSFTFPVTQTANVLVTALTEGQYVFELKVTDNDMLTARDRMIVTVTRSKGDGDGDCDHGNGDWDY